MDPPSRPATFLGIPSCLCVRIEWRWNGRKSGEVEVSEWRVVNHTEGDHPASIHTLKTRSISHLNAYFIVLTPQKWRWVIYLWKIKRKLQQKPVGSPNSLIQHSNTSLNTEGYHCGRDDIIMVMMPLHTQPLSKFSNSSRHQFPTVKFAVVLNKQKSSVRWFIFFWCSDGQVRMKCRTLVKTKMECWSVCGLDRTNISSIKVIEQSELSENLNCICHFITICFITTQHNENEQFHWLTSSLWVKR